MKRRSFVKQSIIGGAVAAVTPAVAMSQAKTTAVEYYELRVYTFKDERQQKLTEDFYRDVFIPTTKKLTKEPVGVFAELSPVGQSKLFVLIPYSNFAQIDLLFDQLENDKAYWTKGSAYLNAPASDPAFEQLDTSILKAFEHSPVKELPAKEERIFELRQYKSASEAAGKKKIEMFNDKGEVDIFKRLGFKPVFFGETVIGDNRPNLTYMVTFKNMDDKAAHWKAFGADPEWKKISAPADYADALLVSKITSTMLKPTAYSLI
ncbi:NIPSNAP family containing protein [Mucilaginibacter sp. MD40]|uniref:NIPSNAP family protein n=1 Tax=Mucilaginibacter sp. MD40 TaxID=2029590 RepID=UPI000BACC729|nr:NIPSNAP family protein [Mucilaginibacter sp. MD40]PAW94622.1 NIPSNAP family containing protein [Mucilaginibacter sp. MD40]